MSSSLRIFSTSKRKRSPRSVTSGKLAITPTTVMLFCCQSAGSSSLKRIAAKLAAQTKPNKLANNSLEKLFKACFFGCQFTYIKTARLEANNHKAFRPMKISGREFCCCKNQAPNTKPSAANIIATLRLKLRQLAIF